MKKILPFLLISAFIFFAIRPLFAEVIDKIAIVVNSEIVTQGEIDRMLEPIYEQYRTQYTGNVLIKKLDEARQKIIEQLIEDRLILSEARRLNIEIDDKDIDDKVNDAVKRFGSMENFEKLLIQQHIAMRDLRMRYREQLMIRKAIDQKVGAKIQISPTEISDYYNKHPAEFVRPQTMKLRNILIRPREDLSPEKALELANQISKKLKEGGDFSELAKRFSEGPGAAEGGLMEDVKNADLMPGIEKALSTLKEGDTSSVIQTNAGYHIFKIEEKKSAGTFTLFEVRRDVEDIIFRKKMHEKVELWLQGLKKNAYIAFK